MTEAAWMALFWALPFSGAAAGLSLIRKNTAGHIAAGNFAADMILLFFGGWYVFYNFMPSMFFPGILPILWITLVIVAVVASVIDGVDEEVGGASVVAWIGVIVVSIGILIGYNAGHDPKAAATIVPVTQYDRQTPPASSTTNMVIVSEEIAKNKASQAMANGTAGQRSYNTYLDLGTPALQYVDKEMMYVFPLHFDGSGNKHRLKNIEPGYIMISAQDSNAEPIERYDGMYTMKICQDCGQDSEPDRWAYQHGYTSEIDDPTLEIDDQGRPFWTETVDTPHVGWNFWAPKSVLVIDAHTGDIVNYAIGHTPDWVDRVISKSMATTITNWFGQYGKDGSAGWNGVGSSNANRFQVSGDPVLVYTGDGHPDWRMLLTSFNSDTAVSKFILMDSHSGAIREYTPTGSMGIEAPVVDAFNNAAGQGAGMVKANKLQATGLTLHVIYGHLTWMATYVPEGDHPSFVGIGFVDAYKAAANNVAYGNTKATALANYLTQLAATGSATGNAPQPGLEYQTVSDKILRVGWDITGSQKIFSIVLAGDLNHVYTGTAASAGPAIVLAQPGDDVTIKFLNTGDKESNRTMQFFSDSNMPLKKPGA